MKELVIAEKPSVARDIARVLKCQKQLNGAMEGENRMKELVIAEKPSVARDIARVLKCQKQLNGAMEGEKYIVTWGLGHLVTLADPEDYDKKYKEWKLEDLPMMPETFRLEVIRQTAKQYNAVKEQIHRKDVGGIIIATDAGREGELVARLILKKAGARKPQTAKQYNAVKEQIHRKDVGGIIIATDAGREGELVARLILKKAGARKPLKRLWISSVTDKAIREGFAHLKDGREYEPLYDAAMCRAEADWLVGINATRALTCKYNAQLSCGRVQTPTLAMIASREEEICRFVPKPYYGIRGRAGSLTLAWKDKKSGSGSSFQKERIENVLKEISGKQAVVERVKKTPKKTMAPLLYDLTELQREASRRFDYSAKETLNIMQRLYENHKVLTYPRTDSRYLSSDIVPTLKERLKACSVGPYRVLKGMLRGPVPGPGGTAHKPAAACKALLCG